MSPAKQKTDYIILAVLGLITAGVLFVFILFDLVDKKDNDNTPGVRSTLSTNVDAIKVAYTLFDKLNIIG